MRYVTWSIYFPDNSNEGSTPETIIRKRGYEADGLFYIADFTILGKISNDADISDLDNYNIKEISKEEVLSLALNKNNTAYIDDSGMIKFDLLSKSEI